MSKFVVREIEFGTFEVEGIGEVPLPSLWVVVNMQSGKVMGSYYCSEIAAEKAAEELEKKYAPKGPGW